MAYTLVPTLFDYNLSDTTAPNDTISKKDAERLFDFFKNCSLFNWKDSHNGCEARADAICVLLDEWKIPNYKGWVFSGAYLKNHIGGLKQYWNYHVAALVQVAENGSIMSYIIDPATSNSLQILNDWAANVTEYPHSYHLIKYADYYIFPNQKINKDNWHTRNKQNRKWMIQGLASINGLSPAGKARLCFNKKRIEKTAIAFTQLKKQHPF